MFARTVRMQLKPNSVPQFTQLIEQEVIPVLRKQQGFKDEITFVPSEGREAVGISLWEQKENAEAYHRGADRKSTRLNSSHGYISYAVFCLKKKKTKHN